MTKEEMKNVVVEQYSSNMFLGCTTDEDFIGIVKEFWTELTEEEQIQLADMAQEYCQESE